MTDRAPRVSIVIPAYQCGRFVRAAVESALGQSATTVDVVVIDDGSTDDTRAVLTPYLDRIQYFRQENAGPARARNRGLRATRGEYVAFLDADDLLLPDKLAAHVAFLDARPEIGVAPSGWQTLDESGALMREFRPWTKHLTLDTRSWLVMNPGLLGATLFRRSWLERADGPFDERLVRSEDTDLFLRLALAGCRMAWFETITLGYRRHAASLTQNSALTEAYAETVLDKFFATPNLPDSLRKLEGRTRFHRLMWVAWTMRRSGDPARVAAYLERSFAVSPHQPETTVRMWCSALAAMDPDPLPDDERRVLLDAIRLAAPADLAPAARSGEAFEWWLRVWRPYVNGDRETGDRGLQGFRETPPSEILTLARTSLMTTPADEMLDAISAFWAAASRTGVIPPSQHSAVAGLYLTAFGQAALGGLPSVAWHALWQAVRASSGTAAIREWLRFTANAAAYATTGAKR